MKRMRLLIFLLFATTAIAGPSVIKIIKWINNQEYNKSQLQQNLTWPKLEQAAENRGIDPNSIKPYWHTIENSVWNYWGKGQMEDGRVLLETKAREIKPNASVSTVGYMRSVADPNNMAVFYLTEIPFSLER